MDSRVFERFYGQTLTLDICNACQGIWFDGQELLQLTPGAVLALLSIVSDVPGGARHPLPARLECPRCAMRLVEVADQQRNTRFSYFRCPRGDGRFLTFYQFLRARNFVRPLDAGEVAELRRHIRQVNCANCGAPIDVERGSACSFCRTPVAILDPDQLRKAVSELQQASGAKGVDPTLPMRLAMERLQAERAFADASGAGRGPGVLDLVFGDAADPIAGGLRALRRILGT
jgi:Zn-finger nucleic acid-binding protein